MSAEPIPLYGRCPQCKRALSGDNVVTISDGHFCRRCYESHDPKADHTRRDPALVSGDQITSAKLAMDRPLAEYVHLPFSSVDAIVGAIPPGDVGFISAFSGRGKTTFVTSAVKGFLDAGKRVYCLPLESEPMRFRTHLACKALGLHAGKVLTGEYKRADPGTWPALRKTIVDELDRQRKGDMAERLYVSPTRRMDVLALTKAAEHAAKLGADVFIIDHIDHILGRGANVLSEHGQIVDRVLDLAQDLELASFCTSQVNHEGVKHDPLGQYMLPQPHHVYMGGKKRQIAAWMIGLGRALKLNGVNRDDLAAVRARRMEAWRVLEPNCMVVGAMKLRNFGERDGQKTYLRVQDGCVTEDAELTALAVHGIQTKGRV